MDMAHNKRQWLAVGFMLALTATSQAQGQSAYVVTITDMRKNNSYEVVSREQLATLKTRLQVEARLFPAAVAAARKEWEASDLTKGKPFQTTGLAARKMRAEGPLNQEMARKKADKKLERDMDRDFEDGKSKGSKKKLSEKEVKKLDREAMREQLAGDAAALVQKHLDALLKETK